MKKLAMSIAAVTIGLAAAGLYANTGRDVAVAAKSPATGTATVQVTLSGVAGQKGLLMGAICSQQSFLKKCAYYAVRDAAQSPVLHFEAVAPGSYAVMVFHDENGNGELDKAANGMPLEGYGFSRNARGRYGPPTFDDARVDLVAGNNNLNVEMVY